MFLRSRPCPAGRLYHLAFQPGSPEAAGPPVTRTVAEVRADPEGWLTEGRPLIVVG